MSEGASNLERRLEELASRVERLERAAGLAPAAVRPAMRREAPPALPPALPVVQPAAREAAPAGGGETAREEPAQTGGMVTPPPIPVAARTTAGVAPGVMEWQAARRAQTERGAAGARGAQPERKKVDLEKLIGGRWYAVLGAVILVVGVGLGFKWAYDNGYLRVSPMWRCLGGAGFGFLMIAAGEYLRRKINAWAAVGAFAAGLGTVYVSAFVAYRMFDLMSPGAAFAMLAATALLGVVISARSGLASVGVISLLAGYITPALFWDQADRPLVLPAYLFAMLGIALVLPAWKGSGFGAVRTVGWWGTVVVGTEWVGGHMGEMPGWAAGFLVVAWLAMQGELVWSAWRKGLMTTPPALAKGAAVRWARWRPLTSSFSTTAWAVGMGVVVLKEWGGTGGWAEAWMSPAGGLGATAMLGLSLAGGLRVVRDEPESDSERLGAGYMVQAAGLLLVTLAMAASGNAEVVCWLVLGAAAGAAGLWMRSRAFTVYAFVSLVIGSARLVVFDSWQAGTGRLVQQVAGVNITVWSMLMVCAALAWGALGMVARRGERESEAPRRGFLALAHLCVSLAFVSLAGSVVTWEFAPGSIGVVWLALGWVMMPLGRRLDSVQVRAFGVVLAAAGSAWVLGSGWYIEEGTARVLGLALSWAVLAPVWAAVAWLGMLRELHPGGGTAGEDRVRVSHVCGVVSLAFALGATAHEDAGSGSVAWAWMATAAGYAGLKVLTRRVAGDALGMLGLVAATWAWAYAWGWRWREYDGAPAGHPGLWAGVVLAGLAPAMAWWFGRGRAERVSRVVRGCAAVWGTGMLLAATSLEVARGAEKMAVDEAVRGAALSIWWGVFAFGLIVAGFWRKSGAARNVGLGLLGVAALKAVIFDLASVPAIWRVASFIGLGLLMMAVTVVYQKFAPKAPSEEPPGGAA